MRELTYIFKETYGTFPDENIKNQKMKITKKPS